MSQLPLDQLIVGFRSCTLPHEAWTHLAHLQVGAWHVHHLGAETAFQADWPPAWPAGQSQSPTPSRGSSFSQ
jgi:hypothetical protein